MATSKGKYGLFIPKKIQKGPVLASTANTNVFDDDSEEESGLAAVNQTVKKEADRTKIKRQTQLEIDKAIQEDPTVYEYDAIYDNIQSEKVKTSIKEANKVDKKPKYIAGLLKMAEVRKREEEQRIERKVQKEREAEGDAFADKEAFVTSAYKQKMLEQQEAAERERQEAAMEAMLDVTKQKDLSGFYRYLYRETTGTEPTADKKPDLNSEEVTVKTEPASDNDGSSSSDKEVHKENNDLGSKTTENKESCKIKGHSFKKYQHRHYRSRSKSPSSKTKSDSSKHKSKSHDNSLNSYKHRRARSRSPLNRGWDRDRSRSPFHRGRDRDRSRSRSHSKRHKRSDSQDRQQIKSRSRDTRHRSCSDKPKSYSRERERKRSVSRDRKSRSKEKERRKSVSENQKSRKSKDKFKDTTDRSAERPTCEPEKSREESSDGKDIWGNKHKSPVPDGESSQILPANPEGSDLDRDDPYSESESSEQGSTPISKKKKDNDMEKKEGNEPERKEAEEKTNDEQDNVIVEQRTDSLAKYARHTTDVAVSEARKRYLARMLLKEKVRPVVNPAE